MNCAFGFTIGGNPYFSNYLYWIFLITTSAVVVLFSFIFIFGKDFAHNLMLRSIAIGVGFAVSFISFSLYSLLNEIGSSEKSVEYTADVYEHNLHTQSFYEELWFTDNNGVRQYVRYEQKFVTENDELITGTKVRIRETEGGFKNYKIYEVLEFEE